jgi:hypothetical protein
MGWTISKAHRDADARGARLQHFMFARHGVSPADLRAAIESRFPEFEPAMDGLKCEALDQAIAKWPKSDRPAWVRNRL